MPGKHHRSPFLLLSRHRYPLVVAVVLLCIAVAGVLAAISNRRSPDPPRLIVPALTALPSPTLIAPAVSAPPPSPSPSRVVASRSARPSRSAQPSSSVRPSPSVAFTAQYIIVNGRRSTFQVGIVVKNTGSAARDWQVVVTHDPSDGVRLRGGVGAQVSGSGDTITVSGGPLGPGKTVTVGFQATRRSDEAVRPTSCKIEGRDCTVTTRRYRNESSGRTR
jgi:hypothetical protein